MPVKFRSVGQTRGLSIPSSIIPLANQFNIFQGKDRVIVFTPKHENPFHQEAFVQSHDFSQPEAFGGNLIGAEIPHD
ncbi:hypothetical protein YK48G_23680 [Lentilactobacillus fungorum]|uniref:Uncharacterized protein n=1 Tax=Lentilactobacillus fungorum TaxID=2201250 RepID=A0ABQ3W177_9LACO|nr:antitoxin of toxin-antitoxin stability system [Lentilactobacillus fungorum]GHP14943.1 hypothetical protein YK48G_23680 [Lentilactobacillus fungorum]